MVVELIGYLKEDSEIRDFFPDGKVPLKSPFPTGGKGQHDEKLELYEVDLDKVSQDTIEEIITWFEGKGFTKKSDRKEIRQHLYEEGFRLQKKHFSSVPIDMRLFL